MNLLGNPEFRYYLTYNSIKTEIIFLPQGWDKNSKVNYTRDNEYFGVIRAWGLPLDFVYDGARILRQAYYSKGIQAGVRIDVEKLNPATLQYDTSFRGDIDFSGAKDNGVVFSTTLMQGGASEALKSRDAIKYELLLTGSDVANMILPGVEFNEESTSVFQPSGIDGFPRYIPESVIATTSFESGFIDVQSVLRQDVNDTSFGASDNWFVKANRTVSFNVSGNMSGMFRRDVVSGVAGFSILIKDNNNNTRATLFSSTNTSFAVPINFNFSENFTLNDDEKLFFYLRVSGSGDRQAIELTSGEFTINYTSVSDPSPCKGLKGIDLLKRLAVKMGISSELADSYLMRSGRWANLIFTSGDAIREIDGAKIKTTFKELFQCFNGIDDAGAGLENEVLRIENGNYFTRPLEILDVGEVSKCEIEPAETYMMSGFKIGYKDGNTDDIDGKQEYNSGQVWQTPITRVQTVKDWVSPYRADQYGIEKIRTEYNVKKTAKGTYDTGSDNDTFIVDCYFDGEFYRPILGSSYENVSGVKSPDSAYNLGLTPKQNLLRKGAFLHSVFDNMDDRYINFASGDKNTELSTTKAGVVVKEDEDVLVGSLPAKYFIPHIATIGAKLPFDARRLFDSSPFGYVKFAYNGWIACGYILNCEVDIARNSEQEFKLLLTADTDLERWERVNR